MSTETPLHVQTAAALGWTDLRIEQDRWWGVEPYGGLRMTVPCYDSSWCSSGPLSERFKIGVYWDHGTWVASCVTDDGRDQYAAGDRPTEAVSRMVVHLHKKGLLKL